MKGQNKINTNAVFYDSLLEKKDFPKDFEFHVCPKCKKEISLYKKTDCPECGFSLAELKHILFMKYQKSLRKCPKCNREVLKKTFGERGCPFCHYPLCIERDGRTVRHHDIANGKIIPTEVELKIARHKNNVGVHSHLYTYDSNGKPSLKQTSKPSQRNIKPRQKPIKQEKQEQKNNIPWFLVGFFGADVARKTGLAGNPAGGRPTANKMCPRCRMFIEASSEYCNKCGGKM
jgi:hypothetical protein